MIDSNLIKCPACGKEVSSQAISCPNCGQPIAGTEDAEILAKEAKQISEYRKIEEVGKKKQKNKKSNKGCTIGCIAGIFIFIIAVVSIVGSIGLNKGIQSRVSGVNNDSEYITLAEFNQIEAGMTYDEVCNIIGSKGTESATSSVAGYNTSIVTWYGNGLAGSNANVTFQNGKVLGKAQVGLK
ncbi:MAG: DUF3862 domain-containing protein [Eubacterium sp.]|nr:DUF3862 domain-containing protein [Eubacterium sp.]